MSKAGRPSPYGDGTMAKAKQSEWRGRLPCFVGGSRQVRCTWNEIEVREEAIEVDQREHAFAQVRARTSSASTLAVKRGLELKPLVHSVHSRRCTSAHAKSRAGRAPPTAGDLRGLSASPKHRLVFYLSLLRSTRSKSKFQSRLASPSAHVSRSLCRVLRPWVRPFMSKKDQAMERSGSESRRGGASRAYPNRASCFVLCCFLLRRGPSRLAPRQARCGP